MSYLSIAAKLVLNVHDLNNEGSIGQSLDIRQIRMVDETGKALEEMPAVSGRMIKHWHLEHMRRRALEVKMPLCNTCSSGQPDRQATAEDPREGIRARRCGPWRDPASGQQRRAHAATREDAQR